MTEKNATERTLTPFCNINEAARRTGLSAWYIRQNINEIPHVKSGKKYMIQMKGLEEFVSKSLMTGETA